MIAETAAAGATIVTVGGLFPTLDEYLEFIEAVASVHQDMGT